jgi:hypothetical protein
MIDVCTSCLVVEGWTSQYFLRLTLVRGWALVLQVPPLIFQMLVFAT